jgi:hypothetical protein
MDMILIIVLLALAAAAAYFFYARSKANPASDAPAKEAEPDPVQDLLALNLKIRKEALARPLATRCETLIDLLVDLIPRVEQAEESSGELAWTVNRIASDYLPNRCVYPFLAMTGEDRESPEQIERFEQSLTVLEQNLNEVADMLSRRDRNEFATKAKFLQHRFTNPGENK